MADGPANSLGPRSGISGPFIRYPVATTLLMIGVLFIGIIGYINLPVAPLPQVDFPTIQVTASYPGASPDTMASSVAQPLERQFAQIPDLSEMTSSSALGQTQITLQFNLNRNIDAAANDVQAAINAATGQLPTDLPNPPTYRKTNPADSPIIILGATSDTMPLTEVDDNIDTKMAQRLSQISGVAQVIIGGEQKPAIRIQVDPAKLVTKGLSLDDVRTALSPITVNSPKGNIDGTSKSFTIYANDQLTAADDWNNAIIAYRNGGAVRVRDIGRAVAGPEDARQAAWQNGKHGVFLVIFKQPGANVISIVDKIKAELPQIRATVPPAIDIAVLSDRTQTIRASILDVEITLGITVILVVLVIFIFLRSLRTTLIPAVTIPLALLGACALMWPFGYSLDNLSLMALTISVGFVVDDAIVMLENITRHIESGMTVRAAAFKGAGEIGFTILAISISLVAVLIPLLLMSGIIGRLFREFSVTLAMAIAVSAIVALTLTPMMASRLLHRPGEERHGRLYALSERAYAWLIRRYEAGLDAALRHRFAMLLVFFATLAATLALYVFIPKGFFPQEDTGLIDAQTEAAQDISFAAMAQKQEQVGAIMLHDPAVYSVAMAIGGRGGSALNTGRMYVTLKPRDQRDATAEQVMARLRPQFDRVEGVRVFMQVRQDVRMGGRPSRTQYQFTLQDPDISELNAASPRVLAALKKLPQLVDVASDQQSAGSTLTLAINRDQAARYGIEPALIDNTLADAFGQRFVAQYFTQLNSYHVVLEILPALQGDLATLDKIYLKSPLTGSEVPLSTFATWTTEPVRPLVISHQGQFPATTISFNLAPGVSLGQATNAVQQAVATLQLPPAMQTQFAGTAQAFEASLLSVPLLIVAALVVVYIVLGILYESFIHPITILSTLPSAGLGALATLMLFGFDFSLIALVGVILLIGIVKKNGIMMVDFAINAEREEHCSPQEAIRKAALLRFRPIMMTTMAAILGGLPLMLLSGAGSEIRQPLGYSIVGGLLVSQALTLFTTPVIYLYLDRLSERIRNWRGGRSTAPRPSPSPAE